MCTAISYKTENHYFGRNLDLEYAYRESVVVTPRNYPFPFRTEGKRNSHYAMIGIATVADEYPLYYDATNEYGLSIAGLNFPGNAVYFPKHDGKQNIAPFEFIPWILSQCKTVQQARKMIQAMNFADIPFSAAYPLTPLHWIVADSTEAITVESTSDGIQIYQNPIGVLTNNPPFPYHMYNLSNYLNLTHREPENRIAAHLDLQAYSRGMGALGLPGDLSSSSRFVRAAFTLHNSVCDNSDEASICQFFHILQSVAQTAGCVQVGDGFEKTVYSSCCNTTKGVYYYTTYENPQITGIDMHEENLDASDLIRYPLIRTQKIYWPNR